MLKFQIFVKTFLTVTYRKLQFRSPEISKQNMFGIEKVLKAQYSHIRKTAVFSRNVSKYIQLGYLQKL